MQATLLIDVPFPNINFWENSANKTINHIHIGLCRYAANLPCSDFSVAVLPAHC